MLVMMETENHLQTKRFNVACSMAYRLWECAAHIHAMGKINTPELTSWKTILGEHQSI